jgi:hypothetical protein
MKFGIFGGGKIGKSNPLGDSYAYQDFIQYVIDAEDLGFRERVPGRASLHRRRGSCPPRSAS